MRRHGEERETMIMKTESRTTGPAEKQNGIVPFASASGSATPKRTRAERKAARRAEWAIQEQQAADYRKRHPILSGAVKIVDYVPPR
jgi:hypothetical protein